MAEQHNPTTAEWIDCLRDISKSLAGPQNVVFRLQIKYVCDHLDWQQTEIGRLKDRVAYYKAKCEVTPEQVADWSGAIAAGVVAQSKLQDEIEQLKAKLAKIESCEE